VPIALGTDTAGSGRVPAGLNNIVGLKPTLGAVSTRGVAPACRSLDCVSVFALSVEDAWTVLDVIAGFDPEDGFSRRVTFDRPQMSKLRIGVPDAGSRRFGGDAASEAAFDAALADAARLGAELCQIDMTPLFAVAALLYDGPWVAERYQALRSFIETKPDSIHPVTRAIIKKARNFSAADLFAAQYKLADMKRASEALWDDIDLLLVPTFPRPRMLADLAADPIGPNSELGTYTNFVNLLDLCALAVPGHFRADGLPAGVTLIAPAGRDALLATFGAQLHESAGVSLGTSTRPLPPTRTAFGIDNAAEIELLVVGGHLSSLPLNHELLTLGGRLIRAAVTTPDYRLYALPGEGVRRPGLLRVAEGAGVAVEAEVWALTPAAFAAFVQSVPSPLSIGTILLSDGTSPKGFLVEAEAVRDSEDISAFRGWRAFLSAQSQGASVAAR
jgi:allophanate hydrolase